MKAILFTLVTLFSINAMADQCQAISYAEAKRASLLLQKNSIITSFCEPCMESRERTGKKSVVSKVKIERVVYGNESYATLNINGKAVDLAYIFVEVAPNRSVNVAKAIGCTTLDESTVSSVIDGDLNSIK